MSSFTSWPVCVQVIAEDVESRKVSSANVTIRLTDINDNRPQFETSPLNASVIETAPEGTVVIAVKVNYYYFASAAVAVDSSHMTASSSTSWIRFSPPSNVF